MKELVTHEYTFLMTTASNIKFLKNEWIYPEPEVRLAEDEWLECPDLCFDAKINSINSILQACCEFCLII